MNRRRAVSPPQPWAGAPPTSPSTVTSTHASLEGLDASEISYASLSEADDDVDPAIVDAIAGNPIPALRPMKKPGGGSLV